MGFDDKWLGWMETIFISHVSSVLLNGVPNRKFQCKCGVRQGDPLSAYLFLFVAEALSLLLNDASASGSLQEFHLNRQAPGISHLLFANDSVLFFKGAIDQAIGIKNILTKYEKGTGQLLSPDKCSMMFGKKCSLENQVAIMVILKMTVEGFEDK